MTNLIEFADTVMAKYPRISGDIRALVQLCIDEIEEGSPESHEIQLCWSDIEELVKEEEVSILSRNI